MSKKRPYNDIGHSPNSKYIVSVIRTKESSASAQTDNTSRAESVRPEAVLPFVRIEVLHSWTDRFGQSVLTSDKW